MISDLESKKKKLIKIAYCILCLLVCIVLLTVDVIRCYNKYLSGEYQLRAEAKIVNMENIDFINYYPGRDYLCHTLPPNGVKDGVYMYNIHNNKCDIRYNSSYMYVEAKDVSLKDLSYSSYDYKLLTGEKRYNLYEYMLRINSYTPNQMKKWFPSGILEKKIYQYFRVLSMLLIFDLLYLIFKLKSKKVDFISCFMNGIMYTSSTFCLLISVFNIYFV